MYFSCCQMSSTLSFLCLNSKDWPRNSCSHQLPTPSPTSSSWLHCVSFPSVGFSVELFSNHWNKDISLDREAILVQCVSCSFFGAPELCHGEVVALYTDGSKQDLSVGYAVPSYCRLHLSEVAYFLTNIYSWSTSRSYVIFTDSCSVSQKRQH